MLTLLSIGDNVQAKAPREGDVYKDLLIQGKSFKVLYGYYEEFERESKFNDPIPIYPDFIKAPVYTDDGIPFATAMQDVCPHYVGKPMFDEGSCMDCSHYRSCEDLIGLCTCFEKKKAIQEAP